MSEISGTKELFQHELSVIDKGRMLLKSVDQLKSEELLVDYKALLAEYEKLCKVSRKIALISDSQGLVLKQRENDIRNLLDHANQGFLLVGSDLLVKQPFSLECERIFRNRKIINANISELLWGHSSEDAVRMDTHLRSVFGVALDDAIQLLSEMPALIHITDKRIAAEYKMIVEDNDSEEHLLMFILTDVTEKLESQEKVLFLSYHDSLTSLFNRYYIEKLMEENALLSQFPYSMLVIDMNGLKLVNDVFGHLVGDRMLVKASTILNRVFDKSAIIGRWGGDEFVVLLPNTDELIVASWIKRLKESCGAELADPVSLSMAVGSATETEAPVSFNSLFSVAEKQMYKQKLLERKQVRIELIQGVSTALVAKGLEEKKQLNSMIDQVVIFAERLGIAENSNEMSMLRDLVLLHDVGNLGLPESILKKLGPLNREEWDIIKGHSEVGCQMAQSIGQWELAEVILGIHERWDGTGYPYGLAGEEIPYLSRLFAIIDAYTVMTHNQVYKQAVSSDVALSRLEHAAAKQFDPMMVEVFLALKS